MIPHLNPFEKFLAWLGWHWCKSIGGYDMNNFNEHYWELVDEYPTIANLILDYCCIRRAREAE